MSDVKIFDLSEKILENIFSELRFVDLVRLSEICESFNVVSRRLLNRGFLGLESQLARGLESVQSEVTSCRKVSTKSLARVLSRYKILQILDSEYRAINCLCGRYVAQGVFCFTGGEILDHFQDILGLKSSEVSETTQRHVTVTIAMLCEEFADNYETTTAASLLTREINSSFGTQVVELLDCFLNSNYHLVVTAEEDDRLYHLAGCYEIFSCSEGVLRPPVLAEEQSSVADVDKLCWLLRYLRNAGRWHNLCHCINTTSRVRKQRLQLCLDAPNSSREVFTPGDSKHKVKQLVFKRTTCASHNDSMLGLTCAMDLRCARSAAPRRLTSSTSVPTLQEVPEMPSAATLTKFYEFSFELKTRYTAIEGTAEVVKETVIMLYQTQENSLIRQITKNIG